MFGYSGHIQELDEFCISNIANIILGYADGYMDEFDEDFIQNCVDNGNYLYYNKNS